MLFTVVLVSAAFILAFVYLKGRYNEYYWKKRGVPFYEKNKSFGPLWEFATGDRPLFQIFNDIYWKFEKEPVVGLGSIDNHGLYVKDPVNIQHIAATDFQSFNDRGAPFIEADTLANNVLFLHGPKWKLIRQKLTPNFTTAKLKNMFYIIDKSAQDFVEYLKEKPERLKGDTFITLSHFCTSAIAAAVFGIVTESTFDSPFRKMASEALRPTLWSNIRFAISSVSDTVFKGLRLKLFANQKKFFVGAIKRVIKQRLLDNVKRHDFVDMCVELQKNGTMVDPETGLRLEPTDELLAAQAFFYFLAGTDPTTAALFASFMELGRHPEILKRVHEDVDALFKKYNDQLTYDSITEMKYLDNVLNEALRLHTPIAFITRQCAQDSVLPVGNVPVEKGVKIFIPIWELHHDPNYFPEPEKFDPDRFEREGEICEAAYLPWGKGHRICIGARYARVQLLTGMIHLLRHFTVETNVHKGGVQYKKEQFQIRLKNVDVVFVPRNL